MKKYLKLLLLTMAQNGMLIYVRKNIMKSLLVFSKWVKILVQQPDFLQE